MSRTSSDTAIIRSARWGVLPDSQSEAEFAVRQLLDEGQTFLAQDLARSALSRVPGSLRLRQSLALALLRAGALGDAQLVLREIRRTADTPDAETLGLVGRVYMEEWKRSRSPEAARRARDAYRLGFEQTRSLWTGINAASLSWVVGERDVATDLARQVLETAASMAPPEDPGDRYWWLATHGEANLLVGRTDEAIQAYERATAVAERRHASVASSFAQLEMLLAHGFAVPPALFGILRAPAIAAFLSPSDGGPTAMDEAEETYLRRRVVARLMEIDARIGYGSAVSTADIIFHEALQSRGAESNVLLPYPPEDVLRDMAAFADRRWQARFDRVLENADTVRYVTDESVPGDDAVFDYLNGMLFGYASLAAQAFRTVPTLLSAEDGSPDAFAAVRPRRSPTLTATGSFAASASSLRRRIKTLLFADVVGYSKLEENRMPAFMFDFLHRVAGHLPQRPRYVNTWGDAIFAIMDGAAPLAEYALALRDIVCKTDWTAFGLPQEMSVRIGLHAGPVFEGTDPLTGAVNYYGSHVNRAARLEGATVPGNVYVSEQFAALLIAEQRRAWQSGIPGGGGPRKQGFACDYIGTLTLPKDFGVQPTYHLRRVERLVGGTWLA